MLAPSNWHWAKYFCMTLALFLVLMRPQPLRGFKVLPVLFVVIAGIATLQLSPAVVYLFGVGGSVGGVSVAPTSTKEVGVVCACLALLGSAVAEKCQAGSELPRLLLLAVLGSALFQASYGVLMVLTELNLGAGFLPKKAYLASATGTLVNRSLYGLYINLGIVVCLWLLIQEGTGKVWVLALRVSLVVLTVGLTQSHSRAAALGFLLIMVAFGGGILCRAGARGGRRLIAGIALLASIVVIDVVIVSNWVGLERLAARIENTSTSAEERFDVTRDLVKGFSLAERPLGFGLGTFESSYFSMKTDYRRGHYSRAHNDLVEGWHVFGVLSVLVAGIVVVALFRVNSIGRAMLALALVPHLILDFVVTNWLILMTFMLLYCAIDKSSIEGTNE